MKDKLKAFWAKINLDAKDLWERDKAFFLAFAALIAFIKFRDIIISLLVSSAKRVELNAQKQDSKLAAQENQANTQANQLQQQAQDLPQTEKPVSDDWYEKKD